jgi:hypothetical protein
VGGYRFTVIVKDKGEPGKNDTFKIQITGPGSFVYDICSLLKTGNVQVQKRR